MQDDFFAAYLDYMKDSAGEVPAFFNRWALIAGIGALLGRNYYFTHGNFQLNPNIYCMLIGNPGTRKSSAIKLMKKLITAAGYSTVAASKTTKEKFLMDLAGIEEEPDRKGGKEVNILEMNLWGDDDTSSKPPAETFIMADEFNNFFGNGNIEFISLLGELWDYEGIFENRTKNGKVVKINNPTISILGGNTPTNLAFAFPPEIIGQGFFSRILLIYGEPNGRRVAFPKTPNQLRTSAIVEYLTKIQRTCIGGAVLSRQAESLLERIYAEHSGIADVRFESYSNRRFNHLLKLCLIVSAARLATEITERDVIYANTILVHTEHLMPKALGEFGKSKNSDVIHKIITVLENAECVMGFQDIWKHVATDLDKMGDLGTMMANLVAADKVQNVTVGENKGFLVKRTIRKEVSDEFVNFDLLTEEERNLTV